jgi:hypothetical protein
MPWGEMLTWFANHGSPSSDAMTIMGSAAISKTDDSSMQVAADA